MKQPCLIVLPLFFAVISGVAQQASPAHQLSRINRFIDFAGAIGNSQGTAAASFVYNWRLGKTRKWELGVGARWTSYFGNRSNFTTAPARLARSTTIPFIIVFAGQETQNWDTLTVKSPFVNSVNSTVNIGYNFNTKWSAGFNIDLAGFSFGRRGNGVLTSNGVAANEPNAKPAAFNVLLTGDNDLGSLNSEFFLKYKPGNRWAVKAVYGFYFAEYKTSTVKQIAPDGTIVDRFRNKVNSLGLGLSWHF